jgi:hypothetical protein
LAVVLFGDIVRVPNYITMGLIERAIAFGCATAAKDDDGAEAVG